MSTAIHFAKPGATITAKARTAVVGRRLVSVSGPAVGDLVSVVQTGAGARAAAVAVRDTAAGANVTLLRDGILPIDAGATITADQALASDASGRVVPATAGQYVVAFAWNDCPAGGVAKVELAAPGIKA